MSKSLNRVQLIGNVGRDPEIRKTQAGKPIANLRIATTDSWKDRDGERHEKTEWHSVVVFQEGLCGVIEKWVRKGSRLMVEGQLQTRKWTDQQGQDRYSTEVVLSAYNGQIILLDGRGAGERQEGRQEPQAARETAIGGGGAGFDDSIPF